MSSDTAVGDTRATGAQPARSRKSSREINETIRYTAFSVFARSADLHGTVESAAAELADLVAGLTAADVEVRGLYDVSGLRPDADLMIWWHGPTAESLQAALRSLRRTAVGRATRPSWAAFGLHRTAEFNKGHVPAFLAGAAPRAWVAVYPFVRSYDWYLLPDSERRAMLVEHGIMGREYDQVLSNTVAAFALGDYEWLLALEADQLHDTVDLMRHLRSSRARMHVREEIPFYTGRRISEAEAVEVVR